jgi:hypothetical protein
LWPSSLQPTTHGPVPPPRPWPSDRNRMVLRDDSQNKTAHAADPGNPSPISFPLPFSVPHVRRLRARRSSAARRPASDGDAYPGGGLPHIPFLFLLSLPADTGRSTRQRCGTEDEPAPLWPPFRHVRAPVGACTTIKRLSGGALCLCPLRRWYSSSPCLGLPMRMEIERNERGRGGGALCRRARGSLR